MATRSVNNVRSWNELRLIPVVIEASLNLRRHLHLRDIIVVGAWQHLSASWARRNWNLMVHHHLLVLVLLLIGIKLHQVLHVILKLIGDHRRHVCLLWSNAHRWHLLGLFWIVYHGIGLKDHRSYRRRPLSNWKRLIYSLSTSKPFCHSLVFLNVLADC